HVLHRVRNPAVVEVLLVVSHPYGDAQRVAAAGEPRVGEVVGRAGLSVDRERLPRSRSCAEVDNVFHDALHLVRDVTWDDPGAVRPRRRVEQLLTESVAYVQH